MDIFDRIFEVPDPDPDFWLFDPETGEPLYEDQDPEDFE